MSLEEIRQTLLSKKGCILNLTSDGKNLKISEKYIRKFLNSLPSNSSVSSSISNAQLPSNNEAIIIPTQVSFSFMSVKPY